MVDSSKPRVHDESVSPRPVEVYGEPFAQQSGGGQPAPGTGGSMPIPGKGEPFGQQTGGGQPVPGTGGSMPIPGSGKP